MFHKIAIVVAIAVVSSSTAIAQLPFPLPLPGATGTPEERKACEPDVVRYCKAYVPDEMRILSCLQDNRKRITPACHAVLIRYGQ